MVAACSCIGPVKGEPLCPCAMMREYGATKAWDRTPEQAARLDAALTKVFGMPDAPAETQS